MSDAIKALEALRQTAPYDSDEEWAKRALKALRAEQPAPAAWTPGAGTGGYCNSGYDVPGSTKRHGAYVGDECPKCAADDVEALHAACVALAEQCKRLQTDFVAAVQFREMYGEQWVENDRLRTQLAKAQADLKHTMNDAERSHGDCEWLRALLKRAAGVLDTHPMKCCGLAACEHSRNRDRLLAEIEWAK